jgi:hypothetical protein
LTWQAIEVFQAGCEKQDPRICSFLGVDGEAHSRKPRPPEAEPDGNLIIQGAWGLGLQCRRPWCMVRGGTDLSAQATGLRNKKRPGASPGLSTSERKSDLNTLRHIPRRASWGPSPLWASPPPRLRWSEAKRPPMRRSGGQAWPPWWDPRSRPPLDPRTSRWPH